MGWIVHENDLGKPVRLLMKSGKGSLHIPGYLICSVQHAMETLEVAHPEGNTVLQIASQACVGFQVAKTVLESTDFAAKNGDLWKLK